MASFAKAYPTDPVDVIISDYMSEANMVTAVGASSLAYPHHLTTARPQEKSTPQKVTRHPPIS